MFPLVTNGIIEASQTRRPEIPPRTRRRGSTTFLIRSQNVSEPARERVKGHSLTCVGSPSGAILHVPNASKTRRFELSDSTALIGTNLSGAHDRRTYFCKRR